ncbi:MAG TPA: type II toxin-antitoxin system VapB family antitoxin [Desulfobacterales bacterium]|nr:MAG: type II toxin-antitoxin system VapB family antitoxin [Deltaproteobacteria bacterium]HDG98269.1 type II toxin-antitoxin system VapB family antitoxin [Desulfobacterales bacterium]
MKTTVVIDDKLLHEAMKAIGARTKREAILAGLKSLIRGKNRELFRKELGTFDLALDLEELERLRHAD